MILIIFFSRITIFSSESEGFLYAKGINKNYRKAEGLLKSKIVTIITSTQDQKSHLEGVR